MREVPTGLDPALHPRLGLRGFERHDPGGCQRRQAGAQFSQLRLVATTRIEARFEVREVRRTHLGAQCLQVAAVRVAPTRGVFGRFAASRSNGDGADAFDVENEGSVSRQRVACRQLAPADANSPERAGRVVDGDDGRRCGQSGVQIAHVRCVTPCCLQRVGCDTIGGHERVDLVGAQPRCTGLLESRRDLRQAISSCRLAFARDRRRMLGQEGGDHFALGMGLLLAGGVAGFQLGQGGDGCIGLVRIGRVQLVEVFELAEGRHECGMLARNEGVTGLGGAALVGGSVGVGLGLTSGLEGVARTRQGVETRRRRHGIADRALAVSRGGEQAKLIFELVEQHPFAGECVGGCLGVAARQFEGLGRLLSGSGHEVVDQLI